MLDEIVITVAGLLSVLFNKQFARHTVSFWNGVRDNFYGEDDFRRFRVLFAIVGCAFIAYGVRDLW